MKRRDSERDHAYAHDVFNSIKIYDIQGILKEGDTWNCGIESYQADTFNNVNFDLLDQEEEKARFLFCRQLGIPYLVIVTSEETSRFRIYRSVINGACIGYELVAEYNEQEIVSWWRKQQSFTQKKGMYNASARISGSRLDALLFANSLAWGVNVDGFSYDSGTGKIKAIFEKRICTCKNGWSVSNYDPDRYFHGTPTRSGDFPSWKILFDLANKLHVPLVLVTFDTSAEKNAGLTRITGVSQQSGLAYKNNIKPYNNIFRDDITGIKNWLLQNLN